MFILWEPSPKQGIFKPKTYTVAAQEPSINLVNQEPVIATQAL